jgi:hypothetical protein
MPHALHSLGYALARFATWVTQWHGRSCRSQPWGVAGPSACESLGLSVELLGLLLVLVLLMLAF